VFLEYAVLHPNDVHHDPGESGAMAAEATTQHDHVPFGHDQIWLVRELSRSSLDHPKQTVAPGRDP